MKPARGPLALALALTLGGCAGGLLGGGQPAQLYRLERAAPAQAGSTVAPNAAQTRVLLLPVRFASGVDGDRILAVDGQRASYLKGARWIASAPELFGQTVRARFADRAPALLLTSEREPAGAALLFQLEVERFEAAYAGAADGAPPVVRIEGEGRLYRTRDRQLVARERFAAEVPAGDNRVGAIVEAFAVATETCADRMADWAGAAARAE